MVSVKLSIPDDVGAARVCVFGPKGDVIVESKLMVPTVRELSFEAAAPGRYMAKVEPVGGSQRLWPFDVGSQAELAIKVPTLATHDQRSGNTISSRRLTDLGAIAAGADFELIVESSQDDPFVFSAETYIHGLDSGTVVRSGGSSRLNVRGLAMPFAATAYSLGLSYDSRPLHYGGWRPVSDQSGMVVSHDENGDTLITFNRGDEQVAKDGSARLRLSFAIERTKVQRILVPLFAGGVRIRMRVADLASDGRLAITPLRRETHALVQALASSSLETAKSIWDDINTGPRHLADYANADVPTDPWVSVAVGLLMMRLGWLSGSQPWVEQLVHQYPWIADASVLAAHMRLAQATPDVDGALRHLQTARRVGALYFFEANRLQGDLLVALAADAPEKVQKEIAGKELNQWRNRLGNQVEVGALFSWLMSKGAQTLGGLDSRYSTVVDRGWLVWNNSPQTASATDGGVPATARRPPAGPPLPATQATPPLMPGENPVNDKPQMIYVNGIDTATGEYAFSPRSLEDVATAVRLDRLISNVSDLSGGHARIFSMPFINSDELSSAGWAIVFHEKATDDIKRALEPLMAARKTQAKSLFKVLDYKQGEQTRDWYSRHGISSGGMDVEIVPYYLLLVGPPDLIPFEFQYQLGIEYAVGRLAFDELEHYERYSRSVVGYEKATALPNAREIVYWGTKHPGDGATALSASFLIDPLANGLPGSNGFLPLTADVGIRYSQKLLRGTDATKAELLETVRGAKPPALLFTASHGMASSAGRPDQTTAQGALLCQDWSGFGSIRQSDYLAASDVTDDANVNGVIAFIFACFSAGTPDVDQFAMSLAQAPSLAKLAPRPFVAALPKRLLSHPNGSALAVIGHVDRAWGFSIQPPRAAGPQIATFRNSLGGMMGGARVGDVITRQFGSRYAELSTILLSSLAPTLPGAQRASDRDIVTWWLERNDAQNYVVLGDPAVRIRADDLA